MTSTENKNLIAQRFAKTLKTYNQNAENQKNYANRLANLLTKFCDQNPINNLLEIGCGTGFLTNELTQKLNINNLYLNDIANGFNNLEIYKQISQRVNKIYFINGDAEKITNIPQNINIVVSSNCIQWFNNFESFLQKLYNHLSDNSIAAFSTFGTENFREIKTLTNNGINYPDYKKILSTLKHQYKVLYFCQTTEKQYFTSTIEMLKTLKNSGVNAIINTVWTPKKLQNFSNEYAEMFSENNKIYITWNPIFFVLKKN